MEEHMEHTMEPAAEAAEAQDMPMEAAEPAAAGGLQEDDLIAFVQEHPGLDAKTIPGSVWEAVKKGDTLSRAYGRHELQQLRANNQQLQRQLGLMQRAAAGRQQSLGSMRSIGSSRAADSFLAGFNDE